jgi:hypothetical protein
MMTVTYGHIACRYALLIAIVTFTGCGGNPFELAPVHGTVTVDDKPLVECKIRFAPIASGANVNPGKAAYGTVKPDGTYRLTTIDSGDGAVVGEHWVTVFNIEEELPDGVPEFGRLSVPQKVAVVAGKDNRIDIKLTKEVVRKYREDDT